MNLIRVSINQGQKKLGVRKGSENICKYINQSFDQNSYISVIGGENDYELYKDYSEKIYNKIKNTEGKTIILGGDHSMSIATVRANVDLKKRTKVLWVDAHADLNIPEKSESGNIHGMVLGLLCGFFPETHSLSYMKCIDPVDICFIGLRDIDPFEKEILEKYNMKYYTTEEVKEDVDNVVKGVDKWLDDSELHVSFDIDVVDPSIAPGTGTPVAEGILDCHVDKICDFIKNKNWHTFEIVEVNPDLDTEDEKTSKYAASIVNRVIV